MLRRVFKIFQPRTTKPSESAAEDIESILALAEIASRDGDSERAAESYARIIRQVPQHALAHYKLANLRRVRDQLEDALAGYDRAIELDPGYANAFCNRGVILERLNQLDDAQVSYERAVVLNPADAFAHYNLGSVLRKLKRSEAALASYDRAIGANPDYVEAYCNRGVMMAERRQFDAAIADFDRSIEINPAFAPAYLYRGNILHRQKHWDAALASYDRAIELDPDFADAICNRGVLWADLRRMDLAFACMDRAIAIKPDFAEAFCNRAALNGAIQKYDLAMEDCNKSIALNPDFADAYSQRAHILIETKKFAAAVEDFDKLMVLKPEHAFLRGVRRHTQMNICDWNGFEVDIPLLIAGIRADEAVVPPMQALGLIDEESLHHAAAKIWVREECPARDLPHAIPRKVAHDKIRIGYFSADFHQHPVGMLMAEVIEMHDREKFEVTAFSFGPNPRDAMRTRLEKTFDRFIEVRPKSDREIAELARDLDLDIAIDLGGFTANCRPMIFALRAAPIQVNYLGYPGTMGAPYMDYLIADETVIPEAHRAYYSEKIVYLPRCYLPHDSTRRIAEMVYTREQLGLPSQGFVYCCFNNSFKLTPVVFDRWMRILQRVPQSVLWLSQGNPAAAANLSREAERRGIDKRRIIFADRMASSERHLARLRAADLFLDTHPYNAHATALDALWAGLPLLTYLGRSFAGRVGASLLATLGLQELVASTPEEYEELAVNLANDASRMAAIRQKLNERRVNTRLFDGQSFARILEAAYTAIYERYRAGLAPEHVYV
jgi:predicted O-linked N-acetylglucosamine transferase (SPINDLY family)